MKKAIIAALVVVGAGGTAALLAGRHRPDTVVARSSSAASAPVPRVASGLRRLPAPKLAALRADQRFDPRSPRYAPQALHKQGVPMAQIFEEEPRNNQWASRVEGNLQPQASAVLGKLCPWVSDLRVECKTATCRMTFKGVTNNTEAMKVNAVLRALYPGDNAGPKQSEYIVSLGGYALPGKPAIAAGDAEQLLADLAGHHERLLAAIQQGRAQYTTQLITADEWQRAMR
jgi:hypothetical protein